MATEAQPAGRAAYRVLRELGSRAQRTFAAKREPHELVVLQRFVRSDDASTSDEGATPVTAEQLAILSRDAGCLAKNWHPNVTRVKHVDVGGPTLSIATELIDGTTLEDLLAAVAARGEALPFDVLLRVVIDVLGGLQAIHALRDGLRAPLGTIHGELCPANIVVGRDGIARVVNALRPRPLRIVAGSEAIAHVAPETLDGTAADPRSDVYAVGVILWSVLARRALHDEKEPGRVLARLRELEIPRPRPPADAAAGPLVVDVAMRAMSFEPSLRFRTAGEMTAELRKVPRIATGSVVAALVNRLAGDRIRARRAALDGSPSGSRPRVSTSAPVAPPAAADTQDTERPPALAVDTSPTEPPPPDTGARATLVPSSEAHLLLAPVSLAPSPPPKIARPSPPAVPRRAAPPVPAPGPSSSTAFAPPPPPPSDPVPIAPQLVTFDEAPAAEPAPRRRGLVVGVAAAIALLSLALVIGLASRTGERRTDAAGPERPVAKAASAPAMTEAPSASAHDEPAPTTEETPPSAAPPESLRPSTSAAAATDTALAPAAPAQPTTQPEEPRPTPRPNGSGRRYEPLGI
jgi:serine/threonine-protein kinase